MKAENIKVGHIENLLAGMQNALYGVYGEKTYSVMMEMAMTKEEVAVVNYLFGK